jgi:hypothetical protein
MDKSSFLIIVELVLFYWYEFHVIKMKRIIQTLFFVKRGLECFGGIISKTSY